MRSWSRQIRRQGHTIGFVPTMGYLHQGHLSLIRAAKKQAEQVVASIYVNPTQFAPGEDLQSYPRDFKRDRQLCEQEGVDVIFYPSDKEMYTPFHKTYVITEGLSKILCGQSRPSHFRGVTTIVAKLLNIVKPHVAVFGQKDFQQAVIIRRMVEDLNFDVQIFVAPIVREADGLAMSSRNKYLTVAQRSQATILYRSLQRAKQEFSKGNRSAEAISTQIRKLINTAPEAKIDYIEIVDAETLKAARLGQRPALVALAVYFGQTRLIDNTVLENENG